MQYKKLIVLAMIVLSLLAISTVSANDNQTMDVVSADLVNEDIASADDFEIEDVIYNSNDNQELLAVSEDDEELSLNNDEEVLSYSYPGYYDYSVYVHDTTIYSDDGGSISMSIRSSSSSSSYLTYKYYYYLNVYDSSGNQKISEYYYSLFTSSSFITYSLSPGVLSAGNYTIKIINYYDNAVINTATLTVKSGSAPYYPSYDDYSVDVYDTTIYSDDGGSISMSISPSTLGTYKYYYYLSVYDSSGNQKINTTYSNRYSSTYRDTYSLSSGVLSAGNYTIKIINYYDNAVLDTATLTVKSGSAPYYPSYDDYSVDVNDTTIYSDYDYGSFISMSISPSSSSNYKYYYYLSVYDSSGNQKISTCYYSQYEDYDISYYLKAGVLSPGTYTVKITNYIDSVVMDTATLTVKSGPEPYCDDYSVDVYDTTIEYGDSGSILMRISPSSSSTYKYYYYLRVYDSSGNPRSSAYYYSQYGDDIEIYYLKWGVLSPGNYTVKIINYADGKVMDTATLEVKSYVIDSFDSTYTELKNTISNANKGSLINLGNDIDFDSNDYSSISISKTLIIDGHGHTIDAKEFSGIFSISGSDVVLKNIVFKNAFSPNNNGSAVYWSGSYGKLINCTFIDNNASNGNGGAVYWSGSFGELINCTFIDNNASNGNGGAVYWAGSNAIITDCKFINNSASYGGAVYLSGPSSTITNCDFTSNSADYQGGALYITSFFKIKNSNFETNDADYGGAIAIGNSHFGHIIECNFNNNSADYGSAIKGYYSVHSINCTFDGAKTNSHKYMYVLSQDYTTLYISAEDIYSGEELNITIASDYDLQGNMTINIFSERLNKTVYSTVKQLDGFYKLDGELPISMNLLIPNLKISDYILNVTYSGDNIYYGETVIDYFEVICKESNITFTVQNVTWGTPIVLNPKVTPGATGFIDIYVNGEYIDTFAVGSKYNLLGVGEPFNEIELVYLGDDIYGGCSYTQTAYVERLNSSTVIVVNTAFSRYATDYYSDGTKDGVNGERGGFFYATLYDVNGNPLANKTVQIAINGPIYNVTTDAEGKAGLQVNLAKANTYTYALYFPGDEGYSASLIASSKLTVVKKPTSIISNSKYAFKPSAKTKTVTVALNTIKNPFNNKLYLKAGKKVTLTVNGKTYSAKTDSKGVAKFNIKLTKTGTYTATVKFAGDSTYESVSKSVKISISKSAGSNAALKGVGIGTDPKELDDPGALNVEGNYADYVVNSNISTGYAGPAKKATIIVVDKKFTRNATDYYSDGTKDGVNGERGGFFYATLTDSDGNPLVNKTVQIAVNGPIYNVTTDKDGQAGLQVNLAKANTYTYALSFSGDDEYCPAMLASSKLTVIKKPITIDVKGLSFKANAKTKTVTVTLKTIKNAFDGKIYLKDGKKVTLKVNGVTYIGFIKNGVVKFNVKLAKKGTYRAVVSFAGDSTYGSTSKTVNIKVK